MQKLTASTVFDFLRGKKLALIGLGVSHRPVARLLAQKQLDVTVYDKKSPEVPGEAAAELAAMGVRFVTGRTTWKSSAGISSSARRGCIITTRACTS